MPIHLGAKTYRLDEAPFKQLVFEVMRCVFDMHIMRKQNSYYGLLLALLLGQVRKRSS